MRAASREVCSCNVGSPTTRDVATQCCTACSGGASHGIFLLANSGSATWSTKDDRLRLSQGVRAPDLSKQPEPTEREGTASLQLLRNTDGACRKRDTA